MVKATRRAAQQDSPRGGSREQISVQPLAPTSRRASQHRGDRERERDSTLVASHPYANTSGQQNGYRNTAYGGSSPVQYNGMGQLGTNNNSPVMPNSSDYMYGQQRQSNGDMNSMPSRANGVAVPKGVNMYGDQNGAIMDQDAHGDAGKRGFWAAFCCRA